MEATVYAIKTADGRFFRSYNKSGRNASEYIADIRKASLYPARHIAQGIVTSNGGSLSVIEVTLTFQEN